MADLVKHTTQRFHAALAKTIAAHEDHLKEAAGHAERHAIVLEERRKAARAKRLTDDGIAASSRQV